MDISTILANQREYFESGQTRGLEFRLEQLRKLQRAIGDNLDSILGALKDDLSKAPFEAYETEVGIVLDELKHIIKHLPRWVKPKKVRTPLVHFLSSSYRIPEPYGIALIMSPWNYPFQLTLAPLLGAIAAGNCSIIKPSNYSSNTSHVISRIMKEYFDDRYIAVLEGGRKINQALLSQSFDKIFFTGSTEVGKLVMGSAARNLTPVTLELGGKSPCIVSPDCDIDLSARRIVWGKLLNAGQTCVAPDYLVVHQSIKHDLIKAMKGYIKEFYGEDSLINPEYPCIINLKHFHRLMALMDKQNIVVGGKGDEDILKIEPTILDGVNWSSSIMDEEIFGPILPIIEYSHISQIIRGINRKPKPLALYLFTKNKRIEREILGSVSFGGGCINDTIIHLATSYMPFGGVGASGMGEYHGKASFDTFSHYKSIVKKSNLIDISLRYPPYGDKLKWIKRLMG
ncbi:MAG TPA: aldehyde dehydrogenase [Clostridia bacterium]|nr:aldehyde dehydrogenase [Clostridia bacterium]